MKLNTEGFVLYRYGCKLFFFLENMFRGIEKERCVKVETQFSINADGNHKLVSEKYEDLRLDCVSDKEEVL